MNKVQIFAQKTLFVRGTMGKEKAIREYLMRDGYYDATEKLLDKQAFAGKSMAT